MGFRQEFELSNLYVQVVRSLWWRSFNGGHGWAMVVAGEGSRENGGCVVWLCCDGGLGLFWVLVQAGVVCVVVAWLFLGPFGLWRIETEVVSNCCGVDFFCAVAFSFLFRYS